MKIKSKLLLMLLVSLISACYEATGCYGPMTGTVVDAETGRPIEGAVVYVQWTVTSGPPGLQTAKIYDVIEKVTDKNGKFRVCGILNPFVNRPVVVVYKKDYVPWRGDYIFPVYEHRKDFEWQRSYVFRLEHYRHTYAHSKHIFFISSGLPSTAKLEQAYSWEDPLARKEEEIYGQKVKATAPGKVAENEIWRQIVEELYLKNGEGYK